VPLFEPEERKPVAIFYATFKGHTRLIAERVASDLRMYGFPVELHNVRGLAMADLSHYGAAVLAAPVHLSKAESAMVNFVKAHRAALEQLPTAFLSITLSQAGAQRRHETPERRARFAADVQMMLEKFFTQTGWRPTRATPVAGALRYTRYNFLLRLVMKRIAKKAGGGTDTSRDYEYTDWDSLDRFVDEFVTVIEAQTGSAASGPVWEAREEKMESVT
jgi:menaquinone-dependent protoporphyrinogen oxidase